MSLLAGHRFAWSRGRPLGLVPVLLDGTMERSPGCSAEQSILGLPFGTGLVLDRFVHAFDGLAQGTVVVVSSGPAHPAPAVDGEESRIKIISPDEVEGFLTSLETADVLAVVQAKLRPRNGFSLAKLTRSCRTFRGATHAIAIGQDGSGAWERVDCDADGQVRRVQRLYGEMNWPLVTPTRVLLSVVPVYLLHGRDSCSARELLQGLSLLRLELITSGAISQDVPVLTDIDHLARPSEFLAAGDREMRAVLSGALPPGYTRPAENVLVGPGCRVHPAAQLVGPVILQEGVTIEEDARIIESVVGAGSRVLRGAVIAHSAVGCRSTVLQGAIICNEVFSGRGRSSNGDSGGGAFVPARGQFHVTERRDLKDVTPTGPKKSRKLHLVAKRVFDVVSSALGLLLLSPVFAVLAILIKRNAPGPVFFVHWRQTRGGREFPCIKFRTMIPGAHKMQKALYAKNEVDGPQFKLENDPRETTIGRWMRSHNVDELPQLINVLLGHMSLVGPRPSPFRENQICIPWRKARLSVRPGITGLWQICRKRREQGDFHQWIFYDMAYVRHFSFWLDLRILMYTLLAQVGFKEIPLGKLVGEKAAAAEMAAHSASAAHAGGNGR